MEYALATQETDSLLFEMLKFLLQAVFATMEEEKEGVINVAATLRASSRQKQSSPPTTTAEGGSLGAGESPPKDSGDAVSEAKLETEAENVDGGCTDGGKEITNDEEAPVIMGDVTEGAEKEEEEAEEEEKPLDMQLQAVKVSAVALVGWPQITQRVRIQELVLDPFTCTEVLRLHFLTSGGYLDSSERNSIRHYRRGGYTDADDPAIELHLRRPDLFQKLATTSVYALSPSDKTALLSTLCSQLLSYAATREYLDEAAGRLKNARKRIREMQFTEERRKRGEKAALWKERKEKAAQLKKQQQQREEEEGKLRSRSVYSRQTQS